MRYFTFFSVILGLVFVFTSCGTEPTDLGSSDSALSSKNSGNSKNKNHKRMKEAFESYSDGSVMPAKYDWAKTGKAHGKITKATAPKNKKHSLQMEIPQDPTGGTYMATKFCLNESVNTYVDAKFSIQFGNFVNWTAFGISNGTQIQYWWWTRADGTIFDDTTFDTLTPNVWHDMEIVIDRDQNLATVTTDGRTHYVELTQVYPYSESATPMKCVFFYAATNGNAQNVFVSNIILDGY